MWKGGFLILPSILQPVAFRTSWCTSLMEVQLNVQNKGFLSLYQSILVLGNKVVSSLMSGTSLTALSFLDSV